MCILTLSDPEETEDEGRVGIVLISHGHVASGMSEVANRLLGVSHAKSVEMSLDESPEDALDRVIDAVISADEGKGVVLLVDMGSLVTFGEIVTQKTGIVTRVIVRTDTVLVIDAVRRAIIPGMDIDQLVSVLEENPKYITRLSRKGAIDHAVKPKAILTVCITGEGSAVKVKELLENLLPDISEKLEIIPIGALTGDTREIIASIRKAKDIIAIVGTINPNINDLPFVFIESILNGSGTNQLRHLVDFTLSSEVADGTLGEKNEKKFGIPLEELFMASPAVFGLEADTKEEAIRKMSGLMKENGAVSDGFTESVLEREALSCTYIGYQSAIPHADPRYVKKPAIGFAKLAHKILWDGYPVQFVFVLALPEDGHEIVTQFYQLLSSEGFEERMARIETGEQLQELLRSNSYTVR